MKRENKYFGFTLIELLAVIVILAIIALIVTPMIMGTINNVRQSSIKASTNGIINAAEQYCMNKEVTDGNFSSKSYQINQESSEKIGFTYNPSISGVVAIYSDCSVAIKLSDEVYQATKDKNSENIIISNKSSNFNPKDIAIFTPSSCFTTSDNGDGTITITGYTCTSTEIVFSDSINSKHITKFGQDAFNNKNLTSVDFSNMQYLTELSNGNFANNNLSYIEISELPELTKIANACFVNNSSKYVKISNLPKLNSISNSAFSIYDGFIDNNDETVEISNLPELLEITNGAFQWHNIVSLTLTALPKLNNLTHSAFSNNKLVALKIYDLPALETIGDGAFDTNKIKNLTLTNLPKLTNLSGGAFTNNLLEYIELSYLPSMTSINNSWISETDNCIKLFKLSHIDNLKLIDTGTFSSYKIQEIEISDMISLEKIDTASFAGNPLQKVTLSNLPNLKTIGDYAFFRRKIKYIDIDGKEKYAGCSPTYTFDNIPNLNAYDSLTKTGLSQYAFAKSTKTLDDNHMSCSGELTPTAIYKNNITSALKNYNYDISISK